MSKFVFVTNSKLMMWSREEKRRTFRDMDALVSWFRSSVIQLADYDLVVEKGEVFLKKGTRQGFEPIGFIEGEVQP